MSSSVPVLAVVGRVVKLQAIEGADRIQSAVVTCGEHGQWTGVVGKEIDLEEKVIVFLQDAILPPDDRWTFMEKMKWRVRMARFKGVPSECLIIRGAPDLEVGSDLTELLGVTKHDKPLPAQMAGDAVGSFPSFIPRTDEENFQKVPYLVEKMWTDRWYATEKADGTSCTVWNDADGLHVCSRNYELKEFTASGGSNVYWRMARKYELDRLPVGLAIQCEIVGPGIQSNPMKLQENEIRVFTVWNTGKRRATSYEFLCSLCLKYALKPAKLLYSSDDVNPVITEDVLRWMADIKYDGAGAGEGIVVRAKDSSWSFKAISLAYKD